VARTVAAGFAGNGVITSWDSELRRVRVFAELALPTRRKSRHRRYAQDPGQQEGDDQLDKVMARSSAARPARRKSRSRPAAGPTVPHERVTSLRRQSRPVSSEGPVAGDGLPVGDARYMGLNVPRGTPMTVVLRPALANGRNCVGGARDVGRAHHLHAGHGTERTRGRYRHPVYLQRSGEVTPG